MSRVVVAIDQSAGVSAAELAAAWDGDEEASVAGAAGVEAARPGDFFGVVELVVVPLAVNLASTAITDMVGRLVAQLTADREDRPELEITEVAATGSGLVVVVRARAERR